MPPVCRPTWTFDEVVARVGASWIVVVAIALIPATFAITPAFAFPLFLGLREAVLLRAGDRGQ
jgi:hypothetical protein